MLLQLFHLKEAGASPLSSFQCGTVAIDIYMTRAIIFVRQKQTLEYLNEQNNWSADITIARTFPNTLHAVEFCSNEQLHNVQVVLRMGDPMYDVTFDVP